MNKKFRNTMLLLGGVLVLAFTSCKNFLNSGDVKKEIEEAIEIANSQKRTYYVVTEKGAGSVVPQSVNVKQKENFQLQFTPEEGWQFIKWQAVDKETGEILENAVYFENPEKTETKAHIINPNENIQIYAKCMELPAVVSVEPSTASAANTPITIKFNIPVEAEETAAEDSLFNFDNIKLTCNGVEVNYLFEKPVFNADKTELVITPAVSIDKGVLLKDYIINELNVGSITIDVFLNTNIVVEIENELYSINYKNLSVYYTPEVDEDAPVTKAFFITRDSSITLENAENFNGNKFIKKDITSKSTAKISDDQEYKELVMNNSCDGTIYIYGHFTDGKKGVKNVTVNEIMSQDVSGRSLPKNLITTVYDEQSDNIIFRTINGETWFLIKYETTPSNEYGRSGGVVYLDVYVNDFCYNSNIEQYTLLMITPENMDLNFTLNQPKNPNSLDISDWTDFETYKNSLKSYMKSLAFYQDLYDEDSYFPIYSSPWCEFYNDIQYDQNMLSIKLQYTKANNETKTVDAKYEYLDPPLEYYDPYQLEYYSQHGYSDPDPEGTYDLKIYFKEEEMDDFDIIPGTSVSLILTNFLGIKTEIILTNLGNNLCLLPTYSGNELTFPVENTKLFPDVLESDDGKKYVNFYNEEGTIVSGILVRKDSQNNIECKKVSGSEMNLVPGYSYSLMDAGIIYDAWFTVDAGALVRPEPVLVDRVEISKYKKDGYLLATVYLNEESLRNYDYVLVDDKLLTEGNSFTSTVLQKYMYYEDGASESDKYISCGWIYGFKDNMLNQSLCKIPGYPKNESSQEIKNAYDNSKPMFVCNMEGKNIIITMIDNWSGINTGTVTIKGTTYNFDAQHTSHSIPIHQFYSSNNIVYSIHCFGSDNAGNVLDEDYANNSLFKNPLWCKMIKYTNTKKINTFETIDREASGILYCKEFNESTNSFDDDTSTFNDTYYFNNPETPVFSDNAYIKIVLQEKFSYSRYPYDDEEYNNYSNPMYYYNGVAAVGCSENDFIISNGSSNQSVVIGSDSPVFVHTVVTSRPLKECKNWDYPEWEYYREEYGEKVLHCETASPKVYNIPVDEIGRGKCYVVIAHYADGKALMSEVMVK